jgi:hypothetical protein
MNRLSCDHSTLFATSELANTHKTTSVFASLTINLLLSHAASIVPSGDHAKGPASFILSLNCILLCFALVAALYHFPSLPKKPTSYSRKLLPESKHLKRKNVAHKSQKYFHHYLSNHLRTNQSAMNLVYTRVSHRQGERREMQRIIIESKVLLIYRDQHAQRLRRELARFTAISRIPR